MKLFAVIPVKNQFHYTRAIVTQLLEQNEGDILVIDNGSTDGTKIWLSKQAVTPRFSWFESPAFLHGMWNAGLDWALRHAGNDGYSVAILNNDLRIGPRFLSTLNRALRLSSRIGVVGGNYDGRPFPEGAQAMQVTSICAGRYDGTGGLPGFAFMLKGEVGYRFPDALHWWYGDNDLVATMAKEQRLCVISRDAVCVHLNGGTQTGDGTQSGSWQSDPVRKQQIEEDRLWFEKKWIQKETWLMAR